MHCQAKTNLFLRVVGKRADGYHDLENVFIPLPEIYDELELMPGDGGNVKLRIEGRELADDRSNLCLKAADAFYNATHFTPDVNLFLRKHIAIAAGLGGGSSDAAGVLLMLNEHHGMPLDMTTMSSIASKLGADVPFFLNPIPALGTGIGDILTPIELNSRFAVIMVTPCFPLSVVWTFAHRTPASPEAPSLQDFLNTAKNCTAQELAAVCRNDLSEAVFDKFPLLCIMRDCLYENGALTVLVSGSGPSIFAIAEHEQAQSIADNFYNKFDSYTKPFITYL